MRLWHIDLIPYLPDLQLVAQWRELNSIYKKEDKHLLINYNYNYPKDYLYCYSNKITGEMAYRGIKIHSVDKFDTYFSNLIKKIDMDFPYWLKYKEHDDRYLRQCFYNLQEKYDRGQKGFTEEIYMALAKFVKSKLEDVVI
jgi:uncharacterized protein (TIGR02328 family)